MPGTPLTKPLHNGRVQTGARVSSMGSRLGKYRIHCSVAITVVAWARCGGWLFSSQPKQHAMSVGATRPNLLRLQSRHERSNRTRYMYGVSSVLLGHARFAYWRVREPQGARHLKHAIESLLTNGLVPIRTNDGRGSRSPFKRLLIKGETESDSVEISQWIDNCR